MHLRDSKFVICCAARTGSTYLVHLLRSNPEILCHGEVIGLSMVGALVGSYAEKRKDSPEFELALHKKLIENPELFLYDNIFDSQDRKVVGFKFKTDELFDPDYARYQEALGADQEIKVIHLVRKNLLDQYISHQVVLNQTGVTLLHSNEVAPEIRPFTCDITHAIAYFEDVVQRELLSEKFYAGHRSISVSYEGLQEKSSGDREAIQKFLGVTIKTLASATKKIIRDNRELLNNLDETLSALSNAGFADRI